MFATLIVALACAGSPGVAAEDRGATASLAIEGRVGALLGVTNAPVFNAGGSLVAGVGSRSLSLALWGGLEGPPLLVLAGVQASVRVRPVQFAAGAGLGPLGWAAYLRAGYAPSGGDPDGVAIDAEVRYVRAEWLNGGAVVLGIVVSQRWDFPL